MQASIYQGTEYEITWTLDDAIDPQLVEKIREAGNELDIDWKSSQFTEGLELLCEKWSKEEIIDRLYDEDPDIVDLLSLVIQFTDKPVSDELKMFIRLYLPVFVVILDYLDC